MDIARRTLLLVDDEENIVRALKRVLRQDRYDIVCAHSGEEGLAILNKSKIGVILSDQRMPGMSGIEFLSQVRELYPDTVRLVLSGYTELNTVTDAINEGSIYKFLTKPWEDDLLRANIQDAFRVYELGHENQRLNMELQSLNARLVEANRKLEERIQQEERTSVIYCRTLDIAREILDKIPLAVLGISADGIVSLANGAARLILGNTALPGTPLQALIPQYFELTREASAAEVAIGGINYQLQIISMGENSHCQGYIVLLHQASHA